VIVLAPLGLLFVPGYVASAAGVGDIPSAAGKKNVTLPAGEFHEECMQLAARQRLDYQFAIVPGG
jgi:hypothetical protein